MGKASRNKKSSDSVKITKVQNPDQGRSWFLPVMVVVTLLGAGAVALLAINRESNADVRPLLSDHWHAAYGVYVCDTFQPSIQDTTDPEGVHTHDDGIIHIHPFRTTASGNNATVDAFWRATGSELTDDGLTPGPNLTSDPVVEADGCNGEPATWQIAYWDNAILADGGAEPDTVISTGLADFRFRGDVAAITFALVPEGAEIPAPPTIAGLSNLTDI